MFLQLAGIHFPDVPTARHPCPAFPTFPAWEPYSGNGNKLKTIILNEVFKDQVQRHLNKAGSGELVNHILTLTVQDGLKQSMIFEYSPLFSEK